MKSKREGVSVLAVFIILTVSFIQTGFAAALKDAESATHGDKAAYYQVVDTYKYPGFEIVQFNLAVLSHYSYMLISDGDALIVDPGRDTYAYLDMAKSMNLSIKGVYLTHSHADFIAGHTQLVSETGCLIYQSDKSGAAYKYEPIKEGSEFLIGKAKVRIVETPGHVVDGTSALVYSPGDDVPQVMFTGDYLFVGGVGRPDLVVGTTSASLAGMLYDTWTEKVSKLGDGVRIFPAHGAGSLCGAHLKDEPYSTIGQEKVSNPYLQYKSRTEFVMAVLLDLQEPPQYFGHNAQINREGPQLINWAALDIQNITPDNEISDSSKYYVADIRSSNEYSAAHIKNSVNIGIRGRFETWVGIMVPWGSELVVFGNAADMKEAVYRLNRIGYTAKSVSVEAWQSNGLAFVSNELIAPEQLYKLMQANNEPVIIDVRLPSEWMGLRIGTVLNLPLNHLDKLSLKLNPDEPVVAVCNSAYRSSMAVGILERNGFTKIASLAGGSEAWINAGLPVYGSEVNGGAAAAVAKKAVSLPERISAAALKAMLMDIPGTFDLVDIRPPQMYADYSIPGSLNVDISDLINDPSYLVGAGPLIIADRDGSIAMAAGGILSQKTQRPIKVLYGGLESYWSQTQPGLPAAVPLNNGDKGETQKSPAPAAPSQNSENKVPQKPMKKSAGC